MQNRLRVTILILATCFVLLPRLASAQVTLTISNPSLFVDPGGTATFMGTFTNTSLTDTFEITSAQINDTFFKMPSFTQLPYTDTAINSDFMVHNASIVHYAPGATFTGAIFSFTVSPSVVPGAYPQLPGNPSFLYNIYDETTASFVNSNPGPSNLSITVVPEPSAAAFLALAFGGLGMIARRGRRSDLAKAAN
jgi:hypothetical protein